MSIENSERIAQYNKEHITDTAMKLFFAKGIQETSVEEIGKLGNISRVTIYKYFPTKLEIVASVFCRYISTCSLCIKENLFSKKYEEANGFEQIRLQLFIYAEMHLENPAILPFISEFNVLLSENREIREVKEKNYTSYQTFNEFYSNAIRKGLEDGSISKRSAFEEHDYLFVRKIVEGVFLKCYLFFGREHFFINQQEVYNKLLFAADKISIAFFKPDDNA